MTTFADPIRIFGVPGVTCTKVAAQSVGTGGVITTRIGLTLVDVISARDTSPTRFTAARAGHVVT